MTNENNEMKYALPVKYTELSSSERKKLRSQYIQEQEGMCMFCNESLLENPPKEITNKKIKWELFPPNFLTHPVHLQHCHKTGMTEGAVHAYCNAVMWQYHGRQKDFLMKTDKFNPRSGSFDPSDMAKAFDPSDLSQLDLLTRLYTMYDQGNTSVTDVVSAVPALIEEVKRLSEDNARLQNSVDSAYTQRMLVVRLLALKSGSRYGVGKDNNSHWDDEWRNVIYIDLPEGQVSWHIAPHDLHIFKDFPKYDGDWDGKFNGRDEKFILSICNEAEGV